MRVNRSSSCTGQLTFNLQTFVKVHLHLITNIYVNTFACSLLLLLKNVAYKTWNRITLLLVTSLHSRLGLIIVSVLDLASHCSLIVSSNMSSVLASWGLMIKYLKMEKPPNVVSCFLALLLSRFLSTDTCQDPSVSRQEEWRAICDSTP